jgi:hypothetical protein
MIQVNAKQGYFCTLRVLSFFIIKVISNSRLFLNEFQQLASSFQFTKEHNEFDVEYRVIVQRKRDKNHILIRNGEVVYETPDRTDLLLALQDWFLDDFIKSTNNHYLLHSAVLVKNGKAIILPAGSRSGKSTLSVALVKNGFKYISDEVAAVDVDTLRVKGFPRAIAIRKKTLSLFPSLEPEIKHLCYQISNSKKAYEIHYGVPSKKNLASMNRSFPISAIVFPKYSPKGYTALGEIKPAVAVFNLMRCSFNQRRLKEKGFRVAVRLVRQRRCYTLQIKDLAKGCEILDNLV